MSEYGPALFIVRKDKQEIPPAEQKTLIALVKAAAKTLKIQDDSELQDKPVKPRFYNYGTYEKGGVGVLLFASYVYSEMPEEVREVENNFWQKEGKKIGKEIEKAHPKVYTFKCYYVEV